MIHEAMLWKKLPGKKVMCELCNRHCVLSPGQTGVCRVRENIDGKLYTLVYGDIVSYAVDPIEKKPLFHFLPGTTAFSIATVGCNFSCVWCLPPDELVLTEKGFEEIGSIFGSRVTVFSHTGKPRKVKTWFTHYYSGPVIRIKPAFAPEIRVTPNHKILIWKNGKLERKLAMDLKKGDFVVIPRLHPPGKTKWIDVKAHLESWPTGEHMVPRIKLTEGLVKRMMELKGSGLTSREIGILFGVSSARVRNILSRVRKEGMDFLKPTRKIRVIEDGGILRFSGSKSRIPAKIKPGDIARLLGLYCAEGSISKDKNRPNSYTLRFSFGHHEKHLADEVSETLERVFKVKPRIVKRRTSLDVEVNNSPLAVLFASLCGTNSHSKKVPAEILNSTRDVILEFVRGYLDGDGTFKRDYIDCITVSRKLAYGIYSLLIMLGVLPGFYIYGPPKTGIIEGRKVRQSREYIVRFSRDFDLETGRWLKEKSKHHFKETRDYFLVPVRKISIEEYSGNVYNMEVETDHTYLDGVVAISNCQNWEISQASPGDVPSMQLMPEDIVSLARRTGSSSIAYTYVEPTVFFELAYDTSKLAVEQGLANVFVTNGYMTKKAWKTLAPYLHGANIDIKGNDEMYVKYMGGVHLEPVLESVRYAKKLGIWVEVTNLLIPGLNDDEGTIESIIDFVKSVDKDMPLHFTAFHPDYKMRDRPPTPRETLVKAREKALEKGLHYVYIGNVMPGDPYENTYCPNCGEPIIERFGFQVTRINLTPDGRCPKCGAKIAGIWDKEMLKLKVESDK